MNQHPFQPKTSSAASEKTFTVNNAIIQVIGWIGALFAGVLCLGLLFYGEIKLSFAVLLFFLISVYLILYSGPLSLNSETITYTTRIAKYQMSWDEVEWIEIDANNSGLVFCGANRKRCIAPYGPSYWLGSEKEELLKLLFEQIQKRQIEVKRTVRASYSVSKNTKVI